MFSVAFQHTKKSHLVLYIVDMFIAQGFKAIFRAIIAIMSFYKDQIIGKSFEEILTFLGDIVRTQIFKNTTYEEYRTLRNQGKTADQLVGKLPHATENEFVYNFKRICADIRVSNRLIAKLESRFYSIGSKLNRL